MGIDEPTGEHPVHGLGLADGTRQALGGVDVLVHNAGIGRIGSIEDTPAADWREMFEVNLLAVVELTRALLPALRTAGGHVVLLNSGAGKRANPRCG